jgi:hypothetical protein
MRRGFDQPTSSSTPRSSGTAPREHTQRTRQGRNDAPVQVNSISARRKSSNQPSLALPQQPTDLQPASSGRKSPAYLEGKNPYGQILDNADHPYRRPKATGGAPSQVGATSESRPRTSGSFSFKTRPEPKTEPEREVTALNPSPAPLPPRTPAKPVSVRAAKGFFESKASQNGLAPPLPPSRASAAARGAIPRGAVSEKQVASLSRRRSEDKASRPARIPSPPTHSAVYPESDMEPCMPRPSPDASSQVEPAQRTNPFTRPNSDSLAPKVVLRKATTPQESPVYDDISLSDPSDLSDQKPRRRKSTNIFETAPRDAKPLGSEGRAVDDNSVLDETFNAPLVALEHADRSDDRPASDETVRRRSTYESVSAAESDEGATEDIPSSSAQARRTEFSRHVRRTFEDDIGSEVKRVRRRKYRSAPLTDQGSSIPERIESKSRESSDSPSGGAPSSVLKRIAGIALNGFSHDGSSSTPSMSRRSTAPGSVVHAQTRTLLDSHNVAVPDHVECRGAYGRRKTKDFGYPGARTKPRSTYRTHKPLQDPDHWTKRACGHYSYMANTELREEASKKLCRQCATKSLPLESQPAKQQQTRSRAATDSSSSSRSSSRRYQHHSERLPTDKCDETFAKDLGYMIDAILEEHTNTLQDVINNIRDSQSNLAQLRRLSEDLVQQCQSGGVCPNLCHTPCLSSCTQHMASQLSQPVLQPVCKPIQQVGE